MKPNGITRLAQVLDPNLGKRVGVVEDHQVYDLTAANPDIGSSTVSLLEASVGSSLGAVVQELRSRIAAPSWGFDELNRAPGPYPYLVGPVDAPEIWAAGVTYRHSRDARMEESQRDLDVYARVYDAPRPELFIKTSHMLRTVGPNEAICIRSDSGWTVPEPELAVVLGPNRDVVAYTIANDVSARDIEGANPLYLPQAKIFNGCCSLGPTLLVNSAELRPLDWTITLRITDQEGTLFTGRVGVSSLKRSVDELLSYLYRDNEILPGTVLMTGTGIVPDGHVKLREGQTVQIGIDHIGTLVNPVISNASRLDGP